MIEQRWTIGHVRAGHILWEVIEKKNRLVDAGEKAIVDSFYRNKSANYFGMTNFYVGMYNGSISESTVLSTLPNEPTSGVFGYERKVIERSDVGFPTMEKHEDDWRVVSKDLTFTASGGDIGPVNGVFLCTSSDNSGTLIGVLSFGVERTIINGDNIIVTVKCKMK
jgi:hypothetical protein